MIRVKKKSTPPSAEKAAAAELVRLAKEQGLSLTGPDGLLKQFTKMVLETALNEEMSGHLGHGKKRAEPDRESTTSRRRHPVEDGTDRVDRSRPDRRSTRSRRGV
jgi:transposase-like protein